MRWTFRQLLQVAVGIFAAAFILAPSAMAQNNSRQAVDQFIANPSKALQEYPTGGAQFCLLIRDVALAEPSKLSAIIALLKDANTDQQSGIGCGLGRAAGAVVRTDPAYANQIQQALAASGFPAAVTAFAGVTGNVATGANAPGGGGGGGGGGVGGQTGSSGLLFGGQNTGTSQTAAGEHYQTSSQNLFTGGSSVSGTSSNNTSVSPH